MEIPEYIYRDAKRFINVVTKPILDFTYRPIENRAIIGGFSKKFRQHPRHESHLIDYYHWVSGHNDWRSGNGLLASATYGELFSLWANPGMFITFEAKLKRFIKNGGEVCRIFLIGSELHNDKSRQLLMRAAVRHCRLGFAPRINSVLDLNEELGALGVKCDMMTGLNGGIFYFFQFPENGYPRVLRTINEEFVLKAQNSFWRLWKMSTDFEKWYAHRPHSYKLPREFDKLIENDCAAISAIAE